MRYLAFSAWIFCSGNFAAQYTLAADVDLDSPSTSDSGIKAVLVNSVDETAPWGLAWRSWNIIGALPPDAVKLGREVGKARYVCRFAFATGVFSGKYWAGDTCHVGWGGRDANPAAPGTFQVLINPNHVQLFSSRGDHNYNRAFAVGQEGNETLFLCMPHDNAFRFAGRTSNSGRTCSVAGMKDGRSQEIQFEDFDLLYH